jgi:hypothetical protein
MRGEFRYLTLPGPDLLDVRHLATTVFASREINLKYLGFNTAALPKDDSQPELNAAQFSVNRLECVHPDSEVFPGDFRRVAEIRSIPWQRVYRAGPFHAINLDLCGGFAGTEKSGGIPNYFAALQALLQNQAHSQEDFLLFITTRMDDNNVDEEAREKLLGVAQRISETCAEYASEFADCWGIEEDSRPFRVAEFTTSAEAFMLGLTQWIVSQGIDEGLSASVRSLMTYRTGSGEGEDDLVSLAMRFKSDPYVHPDKFGLIKTVPAQPSRSEKECAQSVKIPKRVRNRVLVDGALKTQALVFEHCMTESSDLLSSAGYDVRSYRDWVMQESFRYPDSYASQKAGDE